jgi:hypothetical protein
MIKYLSKRDIMELLCITAAQFEWSIKRIGIVPREDSEKILSYSIQNMIQIYDFVYNRKKPIILESKIYFRVNIE